MAKNLEILADDVVSPERGLNGIRDGEFSGLDHNQNYRSPSLDYFTDKIPDKKRREEIKAEVERVFSRYMRDLRKYEPASKRAAMLEQSYNLVPSEEEVEGKDSKEILKQRLYANPGRQYHYLNGVVGDKKKPKDIKYELGRATQYTIKEGWPVLGAGTGWWLANRWYQRGTAQGLTGRLRGSFNKKIWQYFIPGFGQLKTGADAGGFLAKEGIRKLWGLAKTPLLYAIGAYAAYKTIGYFLKRRKEKKLEHQEVERLENLRNDMLLQRENFNLPPQERLQAA